MDDSSEERFFINSPESVCWSQNSDEVSLSDSESVDMQQSIILNRNEEMETIEEGSGIATGSSQVHSPPYAELLTAPCCAQECLKHMTFAELEEVKTKFSYKTINEQNQYLLDSIITRGSHIRAAMQGKALCTKSLCCVLGVSPKRIRRMNQLAAKGVVSVSKVPRRRSKSLKYSEVIAWMHEYFNSIGDRMPHLS